MNIIQPKTEQYIVHRATNTMFAYDGWPSVTVDENGVLYAVASSFRMEHICPFGKTAMYISRDGGMAGANLEVYRRLGELKGLDIVASGGVSFYSDVQALYDMGIYAAIVGKALYTGALELPRLLNIADGKERAE